MSGGLMRRNLILALAVALLPAIGWAQDAGFGERIRVGQKIIVRDVRGAETQGVVQSVDATTLVVKYGLGRFPDPADPTKPLNDTRAFTPAEVVWVHRPAPIWDGAVKGGAVGLAILGIIAGACDCGHPGASGYAVFVGLPAALGLGIDAAWGPKTLYRRSVSSRKLSIGPVISRDRRGIAASIRF